MASLRCTNPNDQNLSGSDSSEPLTSSLSRERNWPTLVILLIVFFTAGGNILVIMAVSLEKKLRNETNFFLRSLAVADLLVGVLVMPTSLLNILYNYSWPLPPVLCPMWIFLDVLFCTSSIMHLCAISLDRYVGIRSPIQHSRANSPYRAVSKIAAVWTISMVISFPVPAIGLRDEQKLLRNGTCVLIEPRFMLVGSSVVFFVPLVIMVVCYCLTMRALQQHLATFSTERRNCASSPQAGLPSQRLSPKQPGLRAPGKRRMVQAIENERRASQVLGVVFFLFLVMWCPFFLTNVVVATCQDGCGKRLLRLMDVFVWAGYVSSGVNPLIYTLFNKNYRRAFSRYLRCRYHTRANTALGNSAAQVHSLTHTPMLCDRSVTDTNPDAASGFGGSKRQHRREKVLKDGVSDLASSVDNISRV